MVSTRRSGGAVEDLNVLSLRSRTIDVESRHPELSPQSQHIKHETPLKRRKIAAESLKSMDLAKSTSPMEENQATALRLEGSADAESSSPPTDIFLPSSVSLVEDGAMGSADARAQLDPAPSLPISENSSEVAKGRRTVHKRFRSESPESETGEDLTATTQAGERESPDVQLELDDDLDAASGDDGVPETLSTTYKRSLPYAPTTKPPKSKKSKLKTSVPEDFEQQKPVSDLMSNNGNLKDGSDKHLPLEQPVVASTSQKKAKLDRPSSKKVRDINKDGITYRTISSKGLRGETSPWLPAKASPESRKIKERLLVRKRVQEVNIGRRPRFVVRG